MIEISIALLLTIIILCLRINLLNAKIKSDANLIRTLTGYVYDNEETRAAYNIEVIDPEYLN